MCTMRMCGGVDGTPLELDRGVEMFMSSSLSACALEFSSLRSVLESAGLEEARSMCVFLPLGCPSGVVFSCFAASHALMLVVALVPFKSLAPLSGGVAAPVSLARCGSLHTPWCPLGMWSPPSWSRWSGVHASGVPSCGVSLPP